MATLTGKVINVRLSVDDFEHLRRAAEAYGETPTALVRRLARSVRVARPHTPGALTLAAQEELGKID